MREGTPSTRVPNYLIWAILSTICCCVPFGIPAIVYAAQVDGKQSAGDYAGAVESSDKARMWCWIAFGLGLVANVLGFALGFFGALLDKQ